MTALQALILTIILAFLSLGFEEKNFNYPFLAQITAFAAVYFMFFTAYKVAANLLAVLLK